MLAHELDFAIGVDTHRDAHALAFLRSPSGARLLEAELAACEAGYANALARALLEGEDPAHPRLVRHRLDRGGDRKLNRAQQQIARQPAQVRSADTGLRRAAGERGPERAGGDPLPQALPRPPSLPSPGGRARPGLTLIEASSSLGRTTLANPQHRCQAEA